MSYWSNEDLEQHLDIEELPDSHAAQGYSESKESAVTQNAVLPG